MPSYVTPKKNTEFIFYCGLVSRSSRPQFQSNPTLATGDVKVSTDGGALSNITTLPVVTPASSVMVKVTLSAAEMNGDNVTVVFVDAAGTEWDDLIVNIQTTAQQIDDLSTLTAAGVWANSTRTLTQSAASVTAAVTGSVISVYRGTTWSINLTGLGNISTYDTVYFSVKTTPADSENDALLRVKNAASGLLRVNRAAPTAATNGTITVNNATTGDITITVNEAETTGFTPASGLYYDVKGVDNDGSVTLISYGPAKFSIVGDITRAVT